MIKYYYLYYKYYFFITIKSIKIKNSIIWVINIIIFTIIKSINIKNSINIILLLKNNNIFDLKGRINNININNNNNYYYYY